MSLTEMFDISSNAVHNSGTLRFGKSCDGISQVSHLDHFQNEGAVVLHSLRADSIATSEVVTRLPRSLDLSDAVMAPSTEAEDLVRLVLKPPRQPMNVFNQQHGMNSACPLAVERTKSSIETVSTGTRGVIDVSSKGQLLLKNVHGPEADTAGQRRKRQKISPTKDVSLILDPSEMNRQNKLNA